MVVGACRDRSWYGQRTSADPSVIEGEPRVGTVVELGQPSLPQLAREPDRMDRIMIWTARPPILAIPDVCHARSDIGRDRDPPLLERAQTRA